MSADLARGLNREVQGPMAKFPASVAAFGKPGGGEWVEGDRLVQADLARTLRAIAEDGPDAFYKGWIADRIAEDMKANGGIISKEDLAAYRAKERAPVRGTYKGLRDRLDAAAELRRRRAARDAQHRRAIRPQGEGAADAAGAAHPDRGDAARLSRSRPFPWRSRLHQRAGGEADVQAAREGHRRDRSASTRRRAASSSARTSSLPRQPRNQTRRRISR